MRRGILGVLLLVLLLEGWFGQKNFVQAQETEAAFMPEAVGETDSQSVSDPGTDQLLEEFDFTDVDAFLDREKLPDLSFGDLAQRMMEGKLWEIPREVLGWVKERLMGNLVQERAQLVMVVLLALLSAFLTNFALSFSRGSVSETGFYLIYLAMITLLFTAFFRLSGYAQEFMNQLLEFMKLLLPTFFLAVGMGGSVSAAGFYELALLILTGVNGLVCGLLLPLVKVFVVVSLVNGVSREDFLSRFADLLQLIIGWCSKTALATVAGLSLIQGMILPALDAFGNTALGKVVSFLPGIGQGAGTVTQLFLGSGRIIKNGIGTAALIVLLVLGAVPMIRLALFALIYRGVGALLQPVCEKRILEGMTALSEGSAMLLRILITVEFLFFLAIAIICISTNT